MVRAFVLGTIMLAFGSACFAALLVMLGGWERISGPTLSARVLIHPLQVPSTYAIDDEVISDELVRRMTRRAEMDAALRIMLGNETNEMLRERAIPRLLNAGVLRRMIQEMEGLGAVIAFAGYRSWGEVSVINSGPETLQDVAITLPFADRVELAGGEALERKAFEGELAAISLGTLDAGEIKTVQVWFNATAEDVAARGRDFRIGADGGVRGSVNLYDPARTWNGAELEIEVWARWLIAAILALAAFAAFGALFLVLVALVRPRLITRA